MLSYGLVLLPYLLLVALVFLLAESVSYATATTLLLGLLAGLLLTGLLSIGAIRRPVIHHPRASLLIAVTVGVLIIAVVLLSRPRQHSTFALSPALESYKVVIHPVDESLSRFVITETAILSPRVEGERVALNDLPQREVYSQRGPGFLLDEVVISPLGADERGYFTANLDRGPLHELVCTVTCPETTVQLYDMPKAMFYEAKYSTDLLTSPYSESETLVWHPINIGTGVAFSFIPPPYHYLRPILRPFLGISSQSGWLALLIGGMIGTIGTITVFVWTFVVGVFSDQVKNRLPGRR